MAKVFDYVNEIMQGKKNLIEDELSEKEYNPFITNKALSQHRDCILLANEMNIRPNLDKKMQYLFLINTVRSRKRQFSPWAKPEKIEDVECVKQFYNYSDSKAQEALRLLDEDQLNEIRKKTNIGGLE